MMADRRSGRLARVTGRIAAWAVFSTLFSAGFCALSTASLAADPTSAVRPGDVDAARIIAADSEPGSWLTHGRTYDEQRFSPLTAVNTQSVSRLGLAWSYMTGSRRGLEGWRAPPWREWIDWAVASLWNGS